MKPHADQMVSGVSDSADEMHPHKGRPAHVATETTLMGKVSEVVVPVTSLDLENPESRTFFTLHCRNDLSFTVRVRPETSFLHLQNLDGLDRDRVHTPDGFREKDPLQLIKKYIRVGRLIVVQGVYYWSGGHSVVDAHTIHLLHAEEGGHLPGEASDGDGGGPERFLFEEGHWWLNQLNDLGHTWLNWQFGNTTSFDYHNYTSHLGITGFPLKSRLQECATISRLIYGLSSAYLLTGAERYLTGARAGVEYQREYFRSFSHDGRRIIWAFGKDGAAVIVPSQSGDDQNTIPLYEQIYCLAGLAQYYRITRDWEVFEDIRRTVNNFEAMYRDRPVYRQEEADGKRWGRLTFGGYFSHVDYATRRWDSEQLGQNRSRKNWNSIGDHIPAYLLNVLLALEPFSPDEAEEVRELRQLFHGMLVELALLIVSHFPDHEHPNVHHVYERFHRNWTPDTLWGWQQDRAIVGHNLKIAWNLCRVHAALETFQGFFGSVPLPAWAPADRGGQRQFVEDLRRDLLRVAKRLGDDMAVYGLDPLRGGCFDAVERNPKNGMPIEFTWNSTKDFWQQEQAILAYLTLYTQTGEANYLSLARECMAFWNLFFLDRDNGGIFFRTNEQGTPEIRGGYGIKAGHAVSGYHAFELNYLAHILIRTSVRHEPFCLYFRPSQAGTGRVLNVLPDYLPPGRLRISRVTVNGRVHSEVDYARFQVRLDGVQGGAEVIVEYTPVPPHLSPRS